MTLSRQKSAAGRGKCAWSPSAGLIRATKLVAMNDLALRCPRCKQTFTGHDREQLADALVAHAEQEHGHAPPREHALARIERREPLS